MGKKRHCLPKTGSEKPWNKSITTQSLSQLQGNVDTINHNVLCFVSFHTHTQYEQRLLSHYDGDVFLFYF